MGGESVRKCKKVRSPASDWPVPGQAWISGLSRVLKMMSKALNCQGEDDLELAFQEQDECPS